jgi:VanZ family protein
MQIDTPEGPSLSRHLPPGPPSPRRLRAWRITLFALLGAVCWLAFSPNPPPQADTGWDKMNHLLAFGVLAVCACMAFADLRHRFVCVTLALLAYGTFIELVQTQIPGRSGEWPDLLADSLGIGAGLLLVALLDRWQRRPRRKVPGFKKTV